MDTMTHVATGIGLAGLAQLDSTVFGQPETVMAIAVATVIGSNAPDFDFVCKYKGNEAYMKQHRGASHSLPALLLWTIVIAVAVSAFFPHVSLGLLFGWTLLAVIVHVLLDICNIYGTQAGRPFSQKWIAYDVLPIFDPLIMSLHLIGFVCWFSGVHPGFTFLVVYSLVLIYITLRFFMYHNVLSNLKIDNDKLYHLIPTTSMFTWKVIAKGEGHYTLGIYKTGTIQWKKSLIQPHANIIINASKQHPFVEYMLNRSKYLYADIVEKLDGYEVHWYDLRFQSRVDEPYIAIIQLDQNLNLTRSHVKHGLIAAPKSV
ncbi:metal-dependent hydrolase [Alkalihalobacterium bogoriense]|uniref:metal-dependent hydrolase n=1 Tax=Alkalihalobacterium bogoriense TaxID=246272 RepID=UPI000685AB1A|nr:metal-dependent hydrolase [Alkalihalobacterium bogoriense]